MFKEYIICFVMCLTWYVKAADMPAMVRYPPVKMLCLSAGGTCVAKGDCPEENRAQKTELCPVNQECCHGLPNSATKCRERGGECFPASYQCSTLTKATDCPNDQKCCVLVI